MYVKLCMDMYHKHIYSSYTKCLYMVKNANTAKQQIFEIISDKYKIGICIKIMSQTCLCFVEIERDKEIALGNKVQSSVD